MSDFCRNCGKIVTMCVDLVSCRILLGCDGSWRLNWGSTTKDIATKTRPFEIFFFQMCSSKSMQREDWMKCMRTTSIVPRLVSIQTALLIFEQYAIRNTMRPIEFLHAITRIARVLYTKSGRYRNANESLLKLLAHCIEHGNWSRQTRRLLLRHL